MEFEGFRLQPQNNISLEFQTFSFEGTILYIEQNPRTVGHFVIQLSVKHGALQVRFKLLFKVQFELPHTTPPAANTFGYPWMLLSV